MASPVYSVRAITRNPKPDRMMKRREEDTRNMLLETIINHIKIDVKKEHGIGGYKITAWLPDNGTHKGEPMAIASPQYGHWASPSTSDMSGYGYERVMAAVPYEPPRETPKPKPETLSAVAALRKEITDWLKM